MAHVKVTPIASGPRHFVLQVYLNLEDERPLVNEVLIDPADFGLTRKRVPFVVETISYGFSGFDAELKFDAYDDEEMVWVLPAASGASQDFRDYGGIADRSGRSDGTGKLLISTFPVGEDNDRTDRRGSMVLKVRARGKYTVGGTGFGKKDGANDPHRYDNTTLEAQTASHGATTSGQGAEGP